MNLLWIIYPLFATYSVATAQTGMAATGSNEFPWFYLLGLYILSPVFIYLVFAGLLSSFSALFSHTKLERERRRALRLIGLNFLEPFLTIVMLVLVVRLAQILQIKDPPPWWFFVLPISSFVLLQIPAFWCSSVDAVADTTFKALQKIALTRAVTVVLTYTIFILPYAWSSLNAGIYLFLTGAVGMFFLARSFLWLGKRAAMLTRQVELAQKQVEVI